MKLRGTDGTTTIVVGSAELPVGKILSVPVPGPPGEPGPQGAPGIGIDIKGSVPTYADLPGTAADTDSYVVEADGLLYTYDDGAWPVDGGGIPWQGDTGPVGPEGPAGPEGPEGPVGPQGPVGPEGPQGDQGLQGIQGVQGEQGEIGPQGTQGDPGPTGPEGPQGEGLRIDDVVADYAALPGGLDSGDAGYAVYLESDGKLYIWTGAAWPADGNGAAIRGPQGPQGDTGPQGAQGIQGIQGEQGVQGDAGVSLDIEGSVATYADLSSVSPTAGQAWIVTADGKLYYYDAVDGFPSDGSGVPFVGPQGPQGIQGEQGEQGVAGTTSWAGITDKPSTFAPSAHTHPISEVTDLQSTLDGKVDENATITGATKTKITYDAKGLVTSGADATSDDIADGTTYKQYPAADKTKLSGIATGATANDTDANLRARSTHTGTQSADTITDGTTNKAYTATEKTKLAGVATGATANDTDANLKARANHTGTQSADTLTDGTTNKAFLATERTKLSGIATGATANDTDANLKARANHTGTQTAATISDFSTAADARVAAATIAVSQLGTGRVTGSTNGTAANKILWTGTAAQYAAIGTKDSNTVYIVTA